MILHGYAISIYDYITMRIKEHSLYLMIWSGLVKIWGV